MVFYGKGEIRDIDSIVLILFFIRSLSPFLSAVKNVIFHYALVLWLIFIVLVYLRFMKEKGSQIIMNNLYNYRMRFLRNNQGRG